MQLENLCIQTPEAFEHAFRNIQERLPSRPASLLVSIFSGWAQTSWVSKLIQKVQHAFPKAIIVGSTTSGEIFSGTFRESTTLVTFMAFQETQLYARVVDFSATTVQEAAESLIDTCQACTHPVGIELLFASGGSQTIAFLEALQALPQSLPVFGGVAGSTNGAPTAVFCGETILHQGLIAVGFCGRRLRIQLAWSRGWFPLGPWFHITAMERENTIAELDHKAAYLVYKKYLDIPPEDVARETQLFPLFLERNGHHLLRLPVRVTEEGGLELYADCRSGERVRLAYGDPGKILDTVSTTCQDIARFAPEAIQLFNCVSRRYFLQEAAKNELQPFADMAPSAGFYTWGEVARTADGQIALLNMTLVTVCFSEREQPKESVQKPSTFPACTKLTGTMKLLRHVTHFIAVTSAELEKANQQLKALAITDTLTGVYNRGEIERQLRDLVAGREQDRAPLSALMMDLDDFKHVNDVYGHAVGDQVLRWTGTVLLQNTPGLASAGRWGGEEFLILLPGKTLDEAITVAEHIRYQLHVGYTLPDGKNISASLGVSQFPDKGSDMGFYRLLDAALYQAKHSGKNCCVAMHGCAAPCSATGDGERNTAAENSSDPTRGTLAP